MSKKALPIIIVLALIAAGLLYLKSRGTDSPVGTEQSQPVAKTVSEAKELAEAIQSGRPTSCKVTKDTEQMVYYVEGARSRIDITSTDRTSHMINDGTYLYIWTDGQEGSGIKMSLAAASASPTEGEAKRYESQAPSLATEADYNALQGQGYTLNCQAATSDASRLTPPGDIKFVDPSAMMQAVPSGAGMSAAEIEQLKKQYSNLDQ